MTLALALAVGLVVLRNVDVVVPVLLYEVDRLSARVVLAAVLAPVFCVTRGNVNVNGLAHHAHGHRLDDHGFLVDEHRGREIANVDATVEPGLADLDRYTHVGREGRSGCHGERGHDQ